MSLGCHTKQHTSDPLTEGFMTVIIPDRSEKKHEIISMSDIEIRLGICVDCKTVYRIVKEEDD